VQAAIGTLNSLPDSSSVVLTNFPLNSIRQNYSASNQNLFDLKSATLCALLEQLGLAQPTRNIFVLRQWDTNLTAYFYIGDVNLPLGDLGVNILARDFDPETLQPTDFVNGVPYTGFVLYLGPSFADVQETIIDPLDVGFNAVADKSIFYAPPYAYNNYGAGFFYAGLTYDDVGGISYLLRTNHAVFERLLPQVRAVANGPIVDGATRPGVGKITFIEHPFDAVHGVFVTFTNQFVDSYITNGSLVGQAVERIVSVPDVLFQAGDTRVQSGQPFLFWRASTGSWINNSPLNSSDPGPGVIGPPITILFHKLGTEIITQEPVSQNGNEVLAWRWGSFDQSTNSSIVYPDLTSETNNQFVVRLRLSSAGQMFSTYTWKLPIGLGGTASLQTSTNLTDWVPVGSATNDGSVTEWYHVIGAQQQHRFFQVRPQ
jgi:hypothetical protein